ncbi:ATP-binding cassette domain-containing protein [Oxobacter pfennigii]
MDKELYKLINTLPLSELIYRYPLVSDFLANMRINILSKDMAFPEILDTVDETIEEEFGISKIDLPLHLYEFLMTFNDTCSGEDELSSLTIIGGCNKSGQAENISLTLNKGDVAAIVGPTGSGKSRLLGDIECLAQRDTPTNRLILINNKELTEEKRFDMNGKLVAQLSQNMNYIMDLTVREFLEIHARSRFSPDIQNTISLCMDCANGLAGEKFSGDTKVTQLSGGQSRALMIADTAFISSSPLVLIDEIENAGIDRKQAIKVLTKKDKIVLIATHDPLLALSADRRIVIKNGGIHKVIETTQEEMRILEQIEKMDNTMQQLRNKLRFGELITEI